MLNNTRAECRCLLLKSSGSTAGAESEEAVSVWLWLSVSSQGVALFCDRLSSLDSSHARSAPPMFAAAWTPIRKSRISIDDLMGSRSAKRGKAVSWLAPPAVATYLDAGCANTVPEVRGANKRLFSPLICRLQEMIRS